MTGRAAKPVAGLTLGGEPRVNLLPPEVADRVRVRRARGLLVALVVLAILLVGAGYGFASIRALAAQAELAAGQERTTELLAERAEYADTAAVDAAIGVIEQARLQAVSTEVIWADVFDELTATLPPNSYYAWTASTTAPWVTPLAPSGPLREPRVATIQLTVRSGSPFDPTAFFRRILEIDAKADMTFDTIALPPGTLEFESTMTLNLSEEALSGRFAPEVLADDSTVEGGSDAGE